MYHSSDKGSSKYTKQLCKNFSHAVLELLKCSRMAKILAAFMDTCWLSEDFKRSRILRREYRELIEIIPSSRIFSRTRRHRNTVVSASSSPSVFRREPRTAVWLSLLLLLLTRVARSSATFSSSSYLTGRPPGWRQNSEMSWCSLEVVTTSSSATSRSVSERPERVKEN